MARSDIWVPTHTIEDEKIRQNFDDLSTFYAKQLEELKEFFEKLGFIGPSLKNSWKNFGGSVAPAAYGIDSHNVVHMRGVLKEGVAKKPAFILPEGYRPGKLEIFTVAGPAANVSTQLWVSSNGEVEPQEAVNTGLNVVFYAEK